MSNKQKECYWDKSIDMSKATLQVDGKVVCKFDNDNQTIIINEGFKTLRELELEARVKDLEERIINHSNTVEEYCSRLANKDKECEELKSYAQRQENQRETYYKEFLKKDRALEEIEGIVTKDYYDNNWADITIKIDSIRDIVNKAKGTK